MRDLLRGLCAWPGCLRLRHVCTLWTPHRKGMIWAASVREAKSLESTGRQDLAGRGRASQSLAACVCGWGLIFLFARFFVASLQMRALQQHGGRVESTRT